MNEFDQFSEQYSAGMEDPLKRLAGSSAMDFIDAKVELLFSFLHQANALQKPHRFLDFGCGTGELLANLKGRGVPWELSGTDISQGMLGELRRRWKAQLDDVRVQELTGEVGQDRFDIITASCVFHHIPPSEWQGTVRKLYGALSSKGILVVFEHNPWNPVTRLIVARAPIDRNAVLLSIGRMETLFKSAGFRNVRSTNFLFFPPRLRVFQKLEPHLSRVPFGGQYMTVGSR